MAHCQPIRSLRSRHLQLGVLSLLDGRAAPDAAHRPAPAFNFGVVSLREVTESCSAAPRVLGPMPAKGQTRRFRDVRDMSGLLQIADVSRPGRAISGRTKDAVACPLRP